MTDSMNFGPEWLRNLSSEGSTMTGGPGGGNRCQLADYRYGREEMLALFEKGLRPPSSLSTFSSLYSEQVLPPLALVPQADEERIWQSRSVPPGGIVRGRGGSLERGGRINRGRGPYQTYGRGGYDGSGGWGGNDSTEWSPRKDYNTRAVSVDNWRRNRGGDEDEGWRTSSNHTRGPLEKWGRSSSWRDGGDGGEERGPPEKSNRTSWQEGMRGMPYRRPWENEDHVPEWANVTLSEAGGSFDASGAFHGSDDEQRDQKATQPTKREVPLQKSVSQQNIVTKTHPAMLPSSQSAISLSKPPDDNTISEENQKEPPITNDNNEQSRVKQRNIESKNNRNRPLESEELPKKQNNTKQEQSLRNDKKQNDINISHNNNIDVNGVQDPDSNNRVEEEFDRLQEDLVKKLVVDEEMPKKITMENFGVSGVPPGTIPPPNLAPPVQDKWYYQDPQGDLQGPFLPSEMAEWFRAGYFTSSLLVRRVCDETFCRLGDLVNFCGGNPFQCGVRLAPLKPEMPPTPDGDLLQYQLLQRQLALRQAASMRNVNPNEPWGNLTAIQQRELLAQQMLQHPQQMAPDIQFLHQQPPNPLMHMINQMQQANKLPGQTLGEKPSNTIPPQLDPIQALVQQMGGLQNVPTTGLPTTIPTNSGLSANLQTSGLSTNLQSGGLLNNFTNLPLNNVTTAGGGQLPTVPVGLPVSGGGNLLDNTAGNGLPVGLPNTLSDNNTLPPRPNPLGAVDPLSSNENDPLKNLLRHLQSKPPIHQDIHVDMDSMWQQQRQFANAQTKPQWQQQGDVPISMWDLQVSNAATTSVPSPLPAEKSTPTPEQLKNQEKERQKQFKEEQKKKREQEEKQAKKEAEDRRKEEQRKKEAEKKAAEKKQKKEEERIRKEIEKAKKEAEEKRMRELEEKRRLKEQRKAEEELRRKSEELKRLEEVEKAKREKEKEDQLRRQQAESLRHENNMKAARVAPWSQANSTPELSLADIQKAEREKRAEMAAVLQQQRAQQAQQEQQSVSEKQSIQLSWAKKPLEPRKVKSLAEIQQEEQDRLSKQAAEARLAQQKEKEANAAAIVSVPSTPWSGQSLTWANTTAQWNNSSSNNNNTGGFWDDGTLQKSPTKPSAVSKSNSVSAVNVNKQPIKQIKSKTKKEEQQVMKLFNNGPAADEFTDWCTSALMKLNSTVDIPTFISFLRDIESALEVRDYCKEYLGDGPTTQQFATQFLEKRRLIKPKAATQKDDMSSPAPAITPSTQHSNDFQEVKGKGKKMKKSKMTKVDNRILGFSVTSNPDRLNVGDRDYADI